MKRLFLFWVIGLGTILSAYPQSRDYYLKQAESYQSKAKYYFNQAEGYERDAKYYNNQAQKYLKDAEYYAGKNDLDRVATYQRWQRMLWIRSGSVRGGLMMPERKVKLDWNGPEKP